MILSKNGNLVSCFLPSYVDTEVYITIDSSKTNSAIAVGDAGGNVLDYYEINGSEDKDVLQLCWYQRKQLKELFNGARILGLGIEDIITKENHGMDRHSARFKITSVFMSFISYFQDNHNLTPELLNNQTWKADVLPPPFNSRTYAKGSLAWFKSTGSKYQYCSDDVTDAICMLKHLCRKKHVTELLVYDAPEPSHKKYNYSIISKASYANVPAKVLCKYNASLTLQQNIACMGNRLGSGRYSLAVIPVTVLSLSDLYQHVMGGFARIENEVILCVALDD